MLSALREPPSIDDDPPEKNPHPGMRPVDVAAACPVRRRHTATGIGLISNFPPAISDLHKAEIFGTMSTAVIPASLMGHPRAPRVAGAAAPDSAGPGAEPAAPHGTPPRAASA